MNRSIRDVVLAGPARTPIGSFLGSLSSVPAPRLGAAAIAGAVQRAGIDPADVDEVIMGCVLQAGLGQAPARQAAIFAGLPDKVECLTLHKVCGSGLKSIMVAAQGIAVGDADIIVAGGMENMSRVPYYLSGARAGFRMGHGTLVDGMIHDGLWDVYNDFHMGSAAEKCARDLSITREDQDEFAALSYRRARQSMADGTFAREIVPVSVPQAKGDPVLITEDEEPKRAALEKMGRLKPAFEPAGTVTAANSSKIDDGAAAVVVLAEARAEKLGLVPQARLVAQASFAHAPADFPTAPVGAIRKVLARSELRLDDIDLFEINEAFAVVALASIRQLGLDVERVNVLGGGIALGHPIGASGARLMVTLLNAMRSRNARRGLVALCIGGGEAAAMIVEQV